MDASSESSTEVHRILLRAFANSEAATWLLSQEHLPPTLSGVMMRHCLTGDHVMSPELEPICKFIHAGHNNYHRQGSESRSESSEKTMDVALVSKSSNLSQHQELAKPEKIVYVCHATRENQAFMSVTDTRSPVSFMEKPSPVVPGVRRTVAELTDEDFMMFVYYYLESGNSTLVTVHHYLDRTKPSSHCVLLFKPYPPHRYPDESDILESVVLTEAPDCQYCLMKGAARCECSRTMQQRSKLPFPAASLIDPFTTWAWLMSIGDSAVRKNVVQFKNHRFHMSFTSDAYLYLRSTFSKAESKEHVKGFSYYLNSVDEALRSGSLKRDINLASKISPALLINPLVGRDVPQPSFRLTLASPSNVYEKETSSDDSNHSPGDQERQEEQQARAEDSQDLDKPQDHNVFKLAAVQSPRNLMADTSEHENPRNQANRHTDGIQPMDEDAEAVAWMQEVESMKWEHDMTVTCKLCRMLFVRKFDLKRHVRATHCKVRSFVCDYEACGARFKRNEHLQTHKNQIHLRKTLACEHCGTQVASEANLRRHLQKVHKVSGRKRDREMSIPGRSLMDS